MNMQITDRGEVVISPIPTKFAEHFANSLRRVLLSSLSGAAISSCFIKGVLHEFQDIPNVKEDVTEIVQNLKKVRLRSFSDRPVSIHLEMSGECTVTADDIIVPSLVEIVNPELHIATLDNENAHLNIQMMVTTGKGFVDVSRQLDVSRQDDEEKQPIGIIPIDRIYSPVKHVKYEVEEMERDSRILFTVQTDGTISAEDALRQSATILTRHFTIFAEYKGNVEEERKIISSAIPIPDVLYDIDIEELDLIPRVYHSLKRNGITKVGYLLAMDDESLLGMRNFGERSLKEVVAVVKARGYLPKNE